MKNQKEYYRVPADEIYGIDDYGQGENFWNHHGNTKEDYMSLAENLPQVNERIENGASLEELRSDPELGACASAYYDPDKMVKVSATEGGYEFDSDGRHRVMAAQELGYDMPVQVRNPEAMDEPPRTYNINNEQPSETQTAQPNQQEENMGERIRGYQDTDAHWSNLAEAEQSNEYPRYQDNASDLTTTAGGQGQQTSPGQDNAADLTTSQGQGQNWDGSTVKVPHGNEQSGGQENDENAQNYNGYSY